MSDRLRELIDLRESALARFIDAECENLARACHAMSTGMRAGGTLIAFGAGAAASDAAHVTVEFMHPVIVGKPALPAIAIASPVELGPIAQRDDVVVVLCHGEPGQAERATLDAARSKGLLTIAMTGGGEPPEADHCFVIDEADAHVVQELQETAYHVLWELVHVFLDRPDAGEACITCGDVGTRARVLEVGRREALVELGGGRESVAIDLVESLAVGDTVLCHAGVALEKL